MMRRTRSQVLEAQSTVHGCCNRHADNQACDCLAEAICDDAQHAPPNGFLFDRPINWRCPTCGYELRFVCAVPVGTDESCEECGDSGYRVHPENGWRKGERCSRGCAVQCSVCNDPNCDNPGGQH